MTPKPDAAAQQTALQIVHLDEALVVVNKPAGLLSVPGRGPDKADCAAVRVQRDWPDARVVHRLDMATSGLLLFARGASAQRVLSAAFEARQVDKRYVAWVTGHVTADEGTIDLPLGPDWPRRPLQRVDAAAGRPALTRWRVLERDPAAAPLTPPLPEDARRTRLELQPVTGRSHQLRVHLAAIGHPILGDTLYAPAEVARAAPRLLLHACAVTLPHPLTGAPSAFHAAPPF